MKKEPTIKDILEQLDSKIAWFHSDDFSLENAKEHFLEIQSLSNQAEKILTEMKNEIRLLEVNQDN